MGASLWWFVNDYDISSYGSGLFKATFSNVSVSVGQDLFELANPATSITRIHEVKITCRSAAYYADAQRLSFSVQRATSPGSGGTALTPVNLDSENTDFSGYLIRNNTTRASGLTLLHTESQDAQRGFKYTPMLHLRPVISPNGKIIIGLENTPSSALTFDGEIIFEVVGEGVQEDMIVVSSLPSAASANQNMLYRLSTDNNLYYTDGSKWYNQTGHLALTPPKYSDFSWVNQGTATYNETDNALYLTDTRQTSDLCRILVKSVTAPYTLIVGFMPLFSVNQSSAQAGIVRRESSSGKLIVFERLYESSSDKCSVCRWNSATSYSSCPLALISHKNDLTWFKIYNTGTTCYYYMSTDGMNFIPIYSESATAWITDDQVGIYINNIGVGGTDLPLGASYVHWSLT